MCRSLVISFVRFSSFVLNFSWLYEIFKFSNELAPSRFSSPSRIYQSNIPCQSMKKIYIFYVYNPSIVVTQPVQNLTLELSYEASLCCVSFICLASPTSYSYFKHRVTCTRWRIFLLDIK